jgi:hypothetical protein
LTRCARDMFRHVHVLAWVASVAVLVGHCCAHSKNKRAVQGWHGLRDGHTVPHESSDTFERSSHSDARDHTQGTQPPSGYAQPHRALRSPSALNALHASSSVGQSLSRMANYARGVSAAPPAAAHAPAAATLHGGYAHGAVSGAAARSNDAASELDECARTAQLAR